MKQIAIAACALTAALVSGCGSSAADDFYAYSVGGQGAGCSFDAETGTVSGEMPIRGRAIGTQTVEFTVSVETAGLDELASASFSREVTGRYRARVPYELQISAEDWERSDRTCYFSANN